MAERFLPHILSNKPEKVSECLKPVINDDSDRAGMMNSFIINQYVGSFHTLYHLQSDGHSLDKNMYIDLQKYPVLAHVLIMC